MKGTEISRHPLHLGLGATVEIEPEITGEMSWFEDYGARHAQDGAEGRLVAVGSFDAPWNMWEMHPKGAELVLCTGGSMTIHQQQPDGSTRSIALGPGQYAINEPGVWHTADVEGEATALFITAGQGTQHRPRDV